MFGSLSVSQQAGLSLRSVARTNKAADAASVLATVNALIGLGKMATANKPELAPLMDFVSAASSGTDVTLSVNVPADRLEDVVRAIDKQKGALAER